MQLDCPQCGIRDARVSRPRGLIERAKSFVGLTQLRCRRCERRWETSVWAGGAWRFARCPRCYRQELTSWNRQHYHPPRWTRFLLRVGAAAMRCEACRCNFASFKPRKGRYSRRHQLRHPGNTPPEEESAEEMP
jgi:hypothetical protein